MTTYYYEYIEVKNPSPGRYSNWRVADVATDFSRRDVLLGRQRKADHQRVKHRDCLQVRCAEAD